MSPRRGVYPGSFNPPTLGHLAIVEAAIVAHDLDRLDMVMSKAPLAKGKVSKPSFEERLMVLERSIDHLEAAQALATELQLIADIAAGYDVVVMGADKWAQINDVRFYRSPDHMSECLGRLPPAAVVPRGPHPVPAGARLDVGADIAQVSSTSARAGNADLMTRAARTSGLW